MQGSAADKRAARALALDLVYLGDTLLTIQECDRGKGVTAVRVTRELGADPDGIDYAVRKLKRGGYIEQVSPGCFRLTLLGRTWLGV